MNARSRPGPPAANLYRAARNGASIIDSEHHDAAAVDGAGFWRHFFQVTLPLILPISLVAPLFGLIFAFTDMIIIYDLTRGEPYDTTQVVGVPTFLVHGDVYFWGPLTAGCFIASVPVAILYNFVVDRFIAGFTVGAIK